MKCKPEKNDIVKLEMIDNHYHSRYNGFYLFNKIKHNICLCRRESEKFSYGNHSFVFTKIKITKIIKRRSEEYLKIFKTLNTKCY